MYALSPLTAKLSDFSAPKNRILFGERLDAVKKIESSVLKHGLFNPIIVMKEGLRLIVVDGSKRLTALRRLMFQGKLPTSLNEVPYIVVEDCRKQDADMAAKPLKLLSNREKYDLVTAMHNRGRTSAEIANHLFVKTSCVRDILNVKQLSPTLRAEFINDRLTLDQARALASLQDYRMQEAIIRVLGPFVSAEEILRIGVKLMKKMKPIDTDIEMSDNIVDFPASTPNEEMTLAACREG